MIEYTYISFINWRRNLVHVPFKTAFNGESNIIYPKFHNAYYGEPILR